MEIVNATKLTNTTVVRAITYIPMSKVSDTTPYSMSVEELLLCLSTIDHIESGTSNVTIVHGASKYASLTLDGVEILRLYGTKFEPITDDAYDLGATAKRLKDLYLSGAINLGSDATGDIYYRNASGKFTRLGIGSSLQTLTVVGGLPAWSYTGNEYMNVLTADVARHTSSSLVDVTGLSYAIATVGTYEYEFFIVGNIVNAATLNNTNVFRVAYTGTVTTATDNVIMGTYTELTTGDNAHIKYGTGITYDFNVCKGTTASASMSVHLKGTIKVATTGTLKLQDAITAAMAVVGDGLLCAKGSYIKVKRIA